MSEEAAGACIAVCGTESHRLAHGGVTTRGRHGLPVDRNGGHALVHLLAPFLAFGSFFLPVPENISNEEGGDCQNGHDDSGRDLSLAETMFEEITNNFPFGSSSR